MNGSYIVEPVKSVIEGDYVIHQKYRESVGRVKSVDGEWCIVDFYNKNGVKVYSKECHIIDLGNLYFRYENVSSTGDDNYLVAVLKEHYFDLIDELS